MRLYKHQIEAAAKATQGKNNMTYQLYKHQTEGVERGKQGNCAFFWDCGTGKTLIMLKLIEHYKSIGIGPALVVCPKSIIEAAWTEDRNRFTPDLSIVSLWSTKPRERHKRLAEEHDIYVVNFESYKLMFKEIQAKGFKILIVDESSKMKDNSTAITRSLLCLAGIQSRGRNGSTFKVNGTIPHRYALSGTPAPNSEFEYWAQVKLATGPGNEIVNDNYYAFRGKYGYSISYGGNRKEWKFAPKGRESFMQTIQPVCHVVRKADAVDLPEQVHILRIVELSPEERKAYNTMRDDLVLRFRDEMVLASTALTEILLLRELASGFVYCYPETNDNKRVTRQVGHSKLDELSELLDELGSEQVLIWINFHAERDAIASLLSQQGKTYAIYPGDDTAIERFQDGKVQYLITNPQSAGHGLTFVNTSYAVYFSLTYSYENYEQSLNRIHRIGQTKKCTYVYILAKDTIDSVIYRTIGKKQELSHEVLSYLRSVHATAK